MASFLLSECLENIFLNFIKPSKDTRIKIFTKDLYSCTLVSRHWCRISTPFLYAYPFHHINLDDDPWFPNKDSYYKLIRTLLSCIPKSEIKPIYTSYAQILSTNHLPFNKKEPYPTFNYVSFIRGFDFNERFLKSQNICHYKNIWLSVHDPDRISSEQTIRIMNCFVKFIFEQCQNLTLLKFPAREKYDDIISLSQFISLISLQKRLQHIILLGDRARTWNVLNSFDFNNVL